MHLARYFTTGALLLAAVLPLARSAWGDDQDAAAARRAELVATLKSDATPDADKALTCKKLAIYGDKDAVPALATLLPHPQLSSWALIALEVIPGPEADAALREALGPLTGRELIGVINSIGVRGDAQAVAALTARLKDADVEIASAAAASLGHIGDVAATKVLVEALDVAPADLRSTIAEACVLCAEKLMTRGNLDEAAKLYDTVRQADVPKQRVIEATRGAILARQAAGTPLLVEQLKSADRGMFAIGLQTARELPGEQAAKALVAAMDAVAADRRPLLVVALADCDAPDVLPIMVEMAKAGEKSVRMAAVGMLSRVGDASCVPVLLGVAVEEDDDLTDAAKTALEGLPGADVDAELADRLAKAEGKARLVLIELAGRRRIEEAVPSLLAAADDSDAQLRAAALVAMGSAAGPGDLGFLISRVIAPKAADDAQAAASALLAAAIRMPDRETSAGQLAAAMGNAPLPAKCSILEVLGAMNGPTALAALGQAAKDRSPELQDAATRLLGDWMSVDAAPVLLDLAKTAPETRYQIRALRGYIRLVRQFPVPDAERAAMCRAALEAATRNEEKSLILEVMERYPSLDMLKLAIDAGKVPSMKNDAARVALAIAQKVGGQSVDVQALLSQIGQSPVQLEIVKAQYGANDKFKDVTEVIRKAAGGLPLIVLPNANYNAAFGGDPIGGVVKTLTIEYRMAGKAGKATFGENATILLPMPK